MLAVELTVLRGHLREDVEAGLDHLERERINHLTLLILLALIRYSREVPDLIEASTRLISKMKMYRLHQMRAATEIYAKYS